MGSLGPEADLTNEDKRRTMRGRHPGEPHRVAPRRRSRPRAPHRTLADER